MSRSRTRRPMIGAGAIAVAAALVATASPSATAAPPSGSGAAGAPDPAGARLVAHSVLPTQTYVPGSEPSGAWTTGNAAVPAPYPAQPVQGFSATHRLRDGSYLVMSDNGFGAKANSADFILAVHRIRPNAVALPTTVGAEPQRGSGTAYLGTPLRLSDPDRTVPWPIWRDGGCAASTDLPQGYSCPEPDRLLTGWDFDVESMQVARDGTYWFGDEFGPYLLHTDAEGRLLEAPIPTPGVKSPSNPTLEPGETPNLGGSRGLEGMAVAPDLRTLHPLLEGVVAEDAAAGRTRDLRLYTVSTGRGTASYDDEFVYYRMDDPAHAIGDFAMVSGRQGLVIERDNNQGAAARVKKVYLVDLDQVDHAGVVRKQLLVDLMNLPNPDGLGGFGDPFTFPYVTIEDVEVVDERTIAVMNDNNFPAAGGRSATEPDVNEYLEIRLPRPLTVSRSLLPSGQVGDPVHRLDVQAHRGGIGMTTEETVAGFAKALELGVTTLELDTQVTEDRAVVVTHDRQVQGAKCRDTAPAFDGDPEYPYVGRYVRDLTLAQVRTLECGWQQLPGFPAQEAVAGPMAELSDVFDLVRRHRARVVTLNVETKVEAGAPEQTAPREVFVGAVAEEIRRSGLQRQVVVQSFDWGALRVMHEELPRVPLAALTNVDFLQVGQPGASPWLGGIDADDFGGDFVAAADSIPGVEVLSPVHGFPQSGRIGQAGYRFYTDADLVRRAHERGLTVIPWTVNDPATLEALVDAGVDGVITDYPNVLREVLRTRGMPLPRAYRSLTHP
ncbi:MAG: esterase-like activity of phytase family protein [Phycicoccus sp.]